MGTPDTVIVGEREGQVKLWLNACATYRLGEATHDRGRASYSVAMREGGYVHVEDSRIVGWEDYPMAEHPIYDKYGEPFGEDSAGLFGDDYFFNPSETGGRE